MVPADFSDPTEAEHPIRIGQAWIEMRRGAWTQHVRDFIFADDTGIEPGQMDALDLLSRRSVASGAHDEAAGRPTPHRPVERDACGPTAGGRARHRDITSRRTTWMAVLLSEFDAAERRQLTELLERFVVSLDRSVDALT